MREKESCGAGDEGRGRGGEDRGRGGEGCRGDGGRCWSDGYGRWNDGEGCRDGGEECCDDREGRGDDGEGRWDDGEHCGSDRESRCDDRDGRCDDGEHRWSDGEGRCGDGEHRCDDGENGVKDGGRHFEPMNFKRGGHGVKGGASQRHRDTERRWLRAGASGCFVHSLTLVATLFMKTLQSRMARMDADDRIGEGNLSASFCEIRGWAIRGRGGHRFQGHAGGKN